METPRIPLKFNQQSERSFDEYMNQAPTVSSEEATGAAWDLAIRDTAVGLLARNSAINEFEDRGVAKISPEEANQRHPQMRVPFREPVNPYVAQLMSDQQEEKELLERKLSTGPQDGWTKTKTVGAGVLAHLMDPIEFGTGMLAGWAVGGLAVGGAFGARAATVAARVGAGEAGLATRLAFNAAEQGVGNLAQEVALEGANQATLAREGFEDSRSSGDILLGIAMNTFASTAFGVGVKEGAFQLNGLKRSLRATSPEADLAVARHVVGSMDQDLRPDVSPITTGLARETSVNPRTFGQPEYTFERLTPENKAGKVFYASTKNSVASLDSSRVPLGDDFGFGTHVTDNPGVANAAASRSMSDSPGSVHQVEIGDLRSLDLDVPLPEGALREQLAELLEAADFKSAKQIVGSESARDVLNYIKNAVDIEHLEASVLDDVKAKIQAAGFNSMQSDGSVHMGVAHDPHNHVVLLDDTLVSQKQTFEPTKGMTTQPDKATLDALAARQNDFKSKGFVDSQKYDATVKELSEIEVPSRQPVSDIRQEIDTILEEVDSLDKQGLLLAEDRKVVEQIREALADSEVRHTLTKAAAHCVGL